MSNLRKKLVLVTGLLAATSVAAGGLVACSEDTTVTPDDGGSEGGPDTGTPDNVAPDAGDAGPDVIIVEAGTLAEFITANAAATCARYKDCCGSPAFDTAKCLAEFGTYGWVSSNTDLAVNGVATGGKVTYDPVVGSACLTAIRNMTCKNTPSAEHKNALDKCYAAATGTVALNQPCLSNAECANTGYCDTANDGGTCTALKAANDPCTINGAQSNECSYRGAGASQCLNGACAPALANGEECTYHYDCQSGGCNAADQGDGGFVVTCENNVDFLAGICELYVPDGG
ncbi:MAG: hypothetical protein KF819_23520 [Labilithrix sp.]|nr:hypothetical protein [Labilithrix sp.]